MITAVRLPCRSSKVRFTSTFSEKHRIPAKLPPVTSPLACPFLLWDFPEIICAKRMHKNAAGTYPWYMSSRSPGASGLLRHSATSGPLAFDRTFDRVLRTHPVTRAGYPGVVLAGTGALVSCTRKLGNTI